MENNRPKRRKDKNNPYTIIDDGGCYYVSFKDGQGECQQVKISNEVFQMFDSFELQDIHYLNIFDRHLEHSEIWEDSLEQRAVKKIDLLEDIIIKNYETRNLHKAINMLPEIQRRRICLYYFDDLTLEEIATLEGCSHPAVIKSLSNGLKKLKKYLSE